MTSVIDFPAAQLVEALDEEDFEAASDASLLLNCFERVQGALETISQGEKIESGDETHVILIETCAALSVLFRRKTGGDVKKVSDDHWDIARSCLLAGEEVPDMHIPIVSAGFEPLPTDALDGLTNFDLARAGLVYADRVREAIMTHSPRAFDMAVARVSSIDATMALHVLKHRLSDGSPPGVVPVAVKRFTPSGETLQ